MPGGKRRLKGVYTGGLQVGSGGTYAKQILAGSATVEVGSIGLVAGSTVCEVVTISGLTASHIIVADMITGNACTVLRRIVAGAGQASLHWAYIAGSGLEAASQTTSTFQYIAVKQ
jgi:hypothetical protein